MITDLQIFNGSTEFRHNQVHKKVLPLIYMFSPRLALYRTTYR
jgi:hypothetical protein